MPPSHVLRKRYPSLSGRPEAATDRPADRQPEWTAAGPARGGPAGSRTYTVPPGGVTLKGVAKAAFGDELEWRKVWDLNPKFSPEEPIPEGTRLALPADAKIGR